MLVSEYVLLPSSSCRATQTTKTFLSSNKAEWTGSHSDGLDSGVGYNNQAASKVYSQGWIPHTRTKCSQRVD